jgi:hypothetical protein
LDSSDSGKVLTSVDTGECHLAWRSSHPKSFFLQVWDEEGRSGHPRNAGCLVLLGGPHSSSLYRLSVSPNSGGGTVLGSLTRALEMCRLSSWILFLLAWEGEGRGLIKGKRWVDVNVLVGVGAAGSQGA